MATIGQRLRELINSDVSTADLDKVADITSSAAELNKLDTVTATTAEIETLASGTAVKTFSETFAFGDFTDGGGASGTYDITAGTIPVGAYFLGASCTALVGFTGDPATAVIVVGDGTDADRYMTGTPSVYTTAANGVALGIPSGIRYHDAAKTITVTVTSAAAFASVTAGSMTLKFHYLA